MKDEVSPIPEKKEIVPRVFTFSIKRAWQDFTKLSANSSSVQWTSDSQYNIINNALLGCLRVLSNEVFEGKLIFCS